MKLRMNIAKGRQMKRGRGGGGVEKKKTKNDYNKKRTNTQKTKQKQANPWSKQNPPTTNMKQQTLQATSIADTNISLELEIYFVQFQYTVSVT